MAKDQKSKNPPGIVLIRYRPQCVIRMAVQIAR